MKKDKLLGLIVIFAVIIFFLIVILNLNIKKDVPKTVIDQIEEALPSNDYPGKG